MVLNTTLLASGWNTNGIYTFVWDDIREDSIIELISSDSITYEQYTELRNADIIGGTQSFGQLQLRAMGTTPTLDIPVTFILYRGDM